MQVVSLVASREFSKGLTLWGYIITIIMLLPFGGYICVKKKKEKKYSLIVKDLSLYRFNPTLEADMKNCSYFAFRNNLYLMNKESNISPQLVFLYIYLYIMSTHYILLNVYS